VLDQKFLSALYAKMRIRSIEVTALGAFFTIRTLDGHLERRGRDRCWEFWFARFASFLGGWISQKYNISHGLNILGIHEGVSVGAILRKYLQGSFAVQRNCHVLNRPDHNGVRQYYLLSNNLFSFQVPNRFSRRRRRARSNVLVQVFTSEPLGAWLSESSVLPK